MEDSDPFFSDEADRTQKTIASRERIVVIVTDSVALSSKLSMGYSTACQAADMVRDEFPDRPVKVLDSWQATISQGFIAIAEIHAAASGARRMQAIVDYVVRQVMGSQVLHLAVA
jgi:fatty acid-binding protein DegV